GKTIHYEARAGTLIMRNAKMQPIASIFYIAYLRRGVRNEIHRPITFAYNGGPGSAANWVDFGGLGPMRVALPPHSGFAEAPPYLILPNHSSILRRTDLVFIDPVGTGFSHVLGNAKPQDFWGIDADAHSVGAFIMRYLTKFNRWNSPKFILGESYGTTRSAVLSNYLQHHGVQLNGVILLSSILNFETASFAPGNDLPYILYLPSEAAVAWYHHRLNPRPKNLPAFLSRVEHFATGAYAHALMMGDTLSPEAKNQVIAKLVQFTSIPAHLWRRGDLRITGSEFQALLLNSEGKRPDGWMPAMPTTNWSPC
ncbi:peptidase S10 serine carboxypeptidase, partial [mine drainage metagenome]